jgi:hypothetical protein
LGGVEPGSSESGPSGGESGGGLWPVDDDAVPKPPGFGAPLASLAFARGLVLAAKPESTSAAAKEAALRAAGAAKAAADREAYRQKVEADALEAQRVETAEKRARPRGHVVSHACPVLILH